MSSLGPKALHLQTLTQAGFPVPAFICFDAEALQTLPISEIASQAHSQLKAASYAVRSAALTEDTGNSSMAGQFHTELEIAPEKLEDAINLVLSDARTKFGDLKQFSIIIQTCLTPEWSGVIFTRHPSGKRQTVIEYANGLGEALVSGTLKPQRQEWFRTEAKPSISEPDLTTALDQSLNIEKLFGHPQDIEWAIQNGVWYVLQSRPITTISKQDALALNYLDAHLPTGEEFLFEQTELSEIAQRPGTLMLDLLKRIYQHDGPIYNVYKSFGLTYQETDFLRVIGNQLFIDRNAELHGLLPSYEYKQKNGIPTPQPVRGEGVITSMKNLWRLNHLKFPKAELKEVELEAENHPLPQTDLATALTEFMRVYELIFTVNFCAQHSKIHTSSTQVEQPFIQLEENLIGNSLDLGDATPFVERGSSSKPDPVTFEWLRESGRKLTVRHIGRLRRLVLAINQDALHCTFDELLTGTADTSTINIRREAYEAGKQFTFHGPLTNIPDAGSGKGRLGISPGCVEGILVDVNGIDSVKDPILYTDLLTPDLAQHFPRIKGLVSNQGGLLSHLAILAREHHIPSIVLGDMTAKPALGASLKIDGSTGEYSLIDIDKNA
ncbi:MAG: PEP/pyruvate-binding domain-containing protein [Candidatus Uhrbacteria bacterium]